MSTTHTPLNIISMLVNTESPGAVKLVLLAERASLHDQAPGPFHVGSGPGSPFEYAPEQYGSNIIFPFELDATLNSLKPSLQ
jgi:hypothetical protein